MWDYGHTTCTTEKFGEIAAFERKVEKIYKNKKVYLLWRLIWEKIDNQFEIEGTDSPATKIFRLDRRKESGKTIVLIAYQLVEFSLSLLSFWETDGYLIRKNKYLYTVT